MYVTNLYVGNYMYITQNDRFYSKFSNIYPVSYMITVINKKKYSQKECRRKI